MKIQFEAGTNYKGERVNFMFYEDDDLRIYAEIGVPEDATEDYGYLTMKNTVIAAFEKRGVEKIPVFWYDGQEEHLESDASVDVPVYVEIDDISIYYVIEAHASDLSGEIVYSGEKKAALEFEYTRRKQLRRGGNRDCALADVYTISAKEYAARREESEREEET